MKSKVKIIPPNGLFVILADSRVSFDLYYNPNTLPSAKIQLVSIGRIKEVKIAIVVEKERVQDDFTYVRFED